MSDDVQEIIISPADQRAGLAKAHVVGDDPIAQSSAIQEIDHGLNQLFAKHQAIAPPYNPEQMLLLFEHSNALRQNIDAYATNIDGYGHRFEPYLDWDDEETVEVMRRAIQHQKLVERQEKDPTIEDAAIDDIPEPSDAEVDAAIEAALKESRIERQRLEEWFETCADQVSFVELRRRTRTDIEITGNGYWEILRNAKGDVAQFIFLPSWTMRILPMGKGAPVEVQDRVRAPHLDFEEVPRYRRFRRYIQVIEQRTVFFKELGDPRTMSARTGKFYDDLKQLKREEEHEEYASEVLHFAVHSSRSVYGIPRWVGNLLSVLGNRQAEEINFLYFENKSVPPLAVLVSGGRLSGDSVGRIRDYVEKQLKGKGNFHSVLVIEAEGDESSGMLGQAASQMKIEIKPLTDAQLKDSLFQGYDERNMDKIGMGFRLPRLLRGDIRDFNRATADAALEFTEGQVFAPERQAFDWQINRRIMPMLNARWWTFRSNGPTRANPMEYVEMIEKLKGVFPPHVLQQLAEEAFGRDFPDLDAVWTQYPLPVFLEMIRAGLITAVDEDTPGDWEVDDVLEGDEPHETPTAPAAPEVGEEPDPEAPPPPPPTPAQARKRIGLALRKRYPKRDLTKLADLVEALQSEMDSRASRRLAKGQREDPDAQL